MYVRIRTCLPCECSCIQIMRRLVSKELMQFERYGDCLLQNTVNTVYITYEGA